MTTMHRVLRYQADLAAVSRSHARGLGLLIEALGEHQPLLAHGLLPVQILLREIEGRWCDVSDHLHDMARTMEAEPGGGQ